MWCELNRINRAEILSCIYLKHEKASDWGTFMLQVETATGLNILEHFHSDLKLNHSRLFIQTSLAFPFCFKLKNEKENVVKTFAFRSSDELIKRYF